jgi:hypothetical protein
MITQVATDEVLHRLRSMPTDLVQLVEAVRTRQFRHVVVPAETILHWRNYDPQSWQLVLDWLTAMDVNLDVI